MISFHTVDPGGPELGWAFWIEQTLTACGLSRCKLKGWSERARYHRAFLEERGAYTDGDLVLSECMRVRGGRNQGNPQILVELNGIAGHVGNAWVEPAAWKGHVPKKVHQPRILAALTPEELALVMAVLPAGKRHNTIDSVGIGLYHLGRLVPGASKKTMSMRTGVPKLRRSSRERTVPSMQSKRGGKKQLLSEEGEPGT